MTITAAPVALAVPRPRAGARSPRPVLSRELLLLAVLYVGYSASRVLVETPEAVAVRHADAVLAVQRALGLAVEAQLVELLLSSTALSVAAGYAYAALHYTVTPAVLVYLWRRHPGRYRRARAVLVAATLVALVGYWLLPTAPPRLMPSGQWADVLALHSAWGWWGADASAPRGLGGLTNEYAAMPSMHVGWAVWSGAAVAWCSRRRWVRVLAVAYPVLIAVVVVATGNHWVLDAVAGAAVVALVALPLWRRSTGSAHLRR